MSRFLTVSGQDVLKYELRHTTRRRTVGIIVDPGGQLSVLAPDGAQVERIENILRRRIKWIRRQQQAVAALAGHPVSAEWVAGETHRYLGRQYRLKFERSSEKSVRLLGGYFVISSPLPNDTATTERMMSAWYREHANALLNDRVRRVLASTTWLSQTSPRVRIRWLRQRWGSTTKSGTVTFNIELVKLPLSCIDYVVAHELVHLVVPNHSPAFWRMLGRVMPDWKRWRERLASIEF